MDHARPLYPFAYFLSFKYLSLSHRSFFVGLKTTVIPTSLYEALSNEEQKRV